MFIHYFKAYFCIPNYENIKNSTALPEKSKTMKTKLYKRYILITSNLFLLTTLVSFALCYCNHKSIQLKIKSGGKEYRYIKLQHKINNLDTEVINTQWIETDHCVIQYNNKFENYLGNMVRISEEAYNKISLDLMAESNRTKPQISYLEKGEFERFANRIGIDARVQGFYFDPKSIVINAEYSMLDSENEAITTETVIHEMTHFITHQIMNISNGPNMEKIRSHFNMTGIFLEGLARYESLNEDEFRKMFQKAFTDTEYLSFEEMNSIFSDEDANFEKSMVEVWILMRFIEYRWGKNTLVVIVHSLDKLTLQEAIEKYTGIPFTQFQIEWIKYMNDLFHNCMIGTPGREKEHGK